ncbi:ribonuclease R [Calycomorphotria hydatis]|uniref:Ribonuclease R n=1 Tax=Calycomorphotria hydatis TaxID=2528027 RepID=A0A517TDW7_9PLAN|nr:ribonuclease R [Calycomorphotria hydatis]QDT66567.1 Ribonuclease R [Calycomorphotria hydatis]
MSPKKRPHPSHLEHRIVELLNVPGYKPVKPTVIARRLSLTKKNAGEFRTALSNLLHAGTVVEDRSGKLRKRSAPGVIVGRFKKTRKGGSVLELDEDGNIATNAREVLLRPEDCFDAASGDEVAVQLSNRRGPRGKRFGQIKEVISRARHNFVGTYHDRDGKGYVRVDGDVFESSIVVGDPGAKGAAEGDKVVIEMLQFPRFNRRGEAVLIKVLGAAGEPGVDTQSIIHEFDLPTEFSAEALEEAADQADRFNPEDLSGREDFTKETIVTIDPVDARDFDDAISLNRTKDGHWHLGVHIADVSHFVEEKSPLDDDAKERATSVYLPGTVIPMLPEVISNGLASLQQGNVRFTKSAMIEFNADGIPVNTEFCNSAINVTRRFAYEEVMPILNEPDKFKATVPAKIRKLLADMHELAMMLRHRRLNNGAIELQLPEVKLQLDREGKVSGANIVEHDESHQIIEEFMLAANQAVATELHMRGVPFIRRVHPEPNEEKLRDFAEFSGLMGYRLKLYQSRSHLQQILTDVKGEPEEIALNYALLRSMKQAAYSIEEDGHYALAFEHYCHFTSPIRRYADLVIHRTIAHELFEGEGESRGAAPAELAKIAAHCSDMSRRAEKAERELIKLKLLQHMATKVGEQFETIVTGVERFGLFCRGVELPFEGLAPKWQIEEALDDLLDYDAGSMALIARRSGLTLRLGAPVKVEITKVDIEARQLDLCPIFEDGAKGQRRRGEKKREDKPQKKTARNLNPRRQRRGRR